LFLKIKMEFENFSIQEFLGIILIGLPCFVFFIEILLEFIARIRENFTTEKRTFFHHHFHYRDKR